MALIILLLFHLFMQVHSQYDQPWLSVSSAERGSVQLDCRTHTHVQVFQCYFFPQRHNTNTKSSASCQLSLTGSDLIRWTGQSSRSPEPVNFVCYYTASVSSGVSRSSSLSRPVPVVILDAPQLLVSPSDGGSVQLDCKPPYEKVSQCFFYPERDSLNLKSPSCQLSLTGSDLIQWIGHSYSSPELVKVICYYTVDVSGVSKPSPHSEPAPVTGLTPVLDKKPKLSVNYDHQLDVFTLVCETLLTESISTGVRCDLYTGDLRFLSGTSRRRSSGKLICLFTASKTDLLSRLQSVKSSEVSCDYSLNSDPNIRSPISDKYNILKWLPVPAQPSTPETKSATASPVTSTHLVTTENLKTGLTEGSSSPSVTINQSTASSLVTYTHLITTTDLKTSLAIASASPSVTKQTTASSPVFSTHLIATEDLKTRLTVGSASPSVTIKQNTASSPVSSTHLITTEDPKNISTQYTSSNPLTERHKFFVIMLLVTGTSVLLALVMSISLCRFIKKHRNERFKVSLVSGDQGYVMATFSNEQYVSEAGGTYSMITSVPTSAKLTAAGSANPAQRCDAFGPEAGGTCSVNTPVPTSAKSSATGSANPSQSRDPFVPQDHTYSEILITAPSGPSGPSEKRKAKSVVAETDVYHTYCTIPDVQVASKQKDSYYSMLHL